LIPKLNTPGTTRPLGIPTLIDRAMQSLYAFALQPIAEARTDPYSFGYLPGLGVMDALQQFYLFLVKPPFARVIFEADIKGFFDNISHD